MWKHVEVSQQEKRRYYETLRLMQGKVLYKLAESSWPAALRSIFYPHIVKHPVFSPSSHRAEDLNAMKGRMPPDSVELAEGDSAHQ